MLLIAILVAANLAAFGQSAIQKVDFNNFTYEPGCTAMEEGAKPEKITVKNGEFERSTKVDDYTDHFFFKIFSVTYGDLNGDKQDEAIVLSNCNTGGTGQFTEGYVYTMKGGKPSLVVRIEGGDRADGGLVSANVDDGLLFVESNESSTNSGACCPEFTVTEKFRLAGGKLISAGQGVRKELYPAERVQFAKGASSKTITVKITAYEMKRYVVGAGASQTLTVTVDTAEASARLRGDVETTDTPNSFTAKLPTKGDYTIEISNGADKDKEITFTIRIN